MGLQITHAPMSCCGMLEAWNFNHYFRPSPQEPSRYTSIDDWRRFFQQIESAQRDKCRNCAMITLSEDQLPVKAVAEECGWKVIQEFYNPNSENYVYIMTKLLWDSESDYRNSDQYNEEDDD